LAIPLVYVTLGLAHVMGYFRMCICISYSNEWLYPVAHISFQTLYKAG